MNVAHARCRTPGCTGEGDHVCTVLRVQSTPTENEREELRELRRDVLRRFWRVTL
jgi:hypothetical protein